MASYDSDSSGEEGEDFTETNVLLGFAAKEPSDDTISYLGGRPTWLDAAAPPSAGLARCRVCNDMMVLLLQLNGGLPEHFPTHERRLYVFICRRKTCRRKEGSVRVVKGLRVSEDDAREYKRREEEKANKAREMAEEKNKAAQAPPSRQLGESLFGAKASSGAASSNPFSSSASAAPSNPFATTSKPAASNPFAPAGLPQPSSLAVMPSQKVDEELPKSFAAALSLNNDRPTSSIGPERPPEPWPADGELPQAFPQLYLVDVDYETLDKEQDGVPIPTQTMDLDEGGGGGGGSQKEDKDVYESTIDKTFQKFADRLAQNPEQVIRYEFRGQPLLYAKHDAVGKLLSPAAHAAHEKVTTAGSPQQRMPRCPRCGSPRTFEMQLTPHAIAELEQDLLDLEGMDWGTIIVGVCNRDCLPPGAHGYVEEWVGVQWEETAVRRA